MFFPLYLILTTLLNSCKRPQGSHDRHNGLHYARDLPLSWLWGLGRDRWIIGFSWFNIVVAYVLHICFFFFFLASIVFQINVCISWLFTGLLCSCLVLRFVMHCDALWCFRIEYYIWYLCTIRDSDYRQPLNFTSLSSTNFSSKSSLLFRSPSSMGWKRWNPFLLRVGCS